MFPPLMFLTLRGSTALLVCGVHLLVLLSFPCSSITAFTPVARGLFLMSATHSADVFKSSIERWDIDDALKQRVNDNMNGEILFAAALQVDESVEALWNAGVGSLEVLTKEAVAIVVSDSPQNEQRFSGDFFLTCVYMSVSGADGKFNDDPFTINMAIACPITSALSKHITSPSLLSTGALGTLTLTLYPVCTANATISAIDSCSHPLKADVPYSIFVPSSRQHQQQKQQSEFFSKKKTTISRHAVITIQTFKNHFTGPMLYMFTRHYQRLGYAVIVFDRFANHQDLFTKDFSDPNTSGVYYYGFTMFEKMFPDIYNDSYSRRQSENFLHYHHFETKRNNRSYVQGRETQNQNSDKRKTYNFARHLHPEYDAMFYIDRDELLYCPPSNTSAADSLKEQAERQYNVIDHYISRGFDRLSFQRFAYAARIPPSFSLSLSESRRESESMRESVMDEYVPSCLLEGYEARSMTKLWNCFGAHFEVQRQFKSGDVRLGKVCPFIGLHQPCLRCKCNKHIVTQRRPKQIGSSCHFMHLNNAHVKAWMNPKKWNHAINEANIPQITLWKDEETQLSDMQ